MWFVDWDTGERFLGKLIPATENGLETVLQFFRDEKDRDGFTVDRLKTGAIAILQASGKEMLSLQEAGYRLYMD